MHKGYKCLNISTGRVYISRDVVFDEHVFPFSKFHPNTRALLLSQILLLHENLTNPNSSDHQEKALGQLTNTPCNTDGNGASCKQNRRHFVQESPSAESQGTGAEHEGDPLPTSDQAMSGGSASDQPPTDQSVPARQDSPGPGVSESPCGARNPPSTRCCLTTSRATPCVRHAAKLRPLRETHLLRSTTHPDPAGAPDQELGSSAAADTRRVTRLQHGIHKPRRYTDGTIR